MVIVDPYVDLDTGTVMIALAKTLCDNVSVVGIDLSMDLLQKIIEDHGGTIRAESEPGVHTTIIFTLPLYKEEKIDAIEQGETVSKDRLPGVLSRALDSSRKIIAAARERSEGRDRRGYPKKGPKEPKEAKVVKESKEVKEVKEVNEITDPEEQ